VSAAALTTILIGTAVAFLAPLQLWASAAPSLPRGSRWLGVAALGSTGVAIALALLYESRSVEQALLARRLVPILFAPLYVGVVRFSEGHLDTRLRGNALFVCGMIGAVTVASFVPGAIYIEQPVLRTIWLPRTQYVDVGVSRFVLTLGLTMVPPVFQLVQAHRRHAVDRGRGWRTGFAVISIWSLCVANDIAAFLGVIATPFVLPLGNACIVVALTFIVLLRFVKALASVEAEAALLQQLVDQRAHELRERDLQIAQGVPLAAAGTLAAGLAHELNNPLAFVVANLNQLEGLRKDPAAHAEFEQVLLETREGTARMRSILTQLDGLARGSAGQHQKIDLCVVIESILPIVRQQAGGHVRLDLHLAPVRVRGDANLLGQVALNLALNALHAARESASQPRVSIATAAALGRAWLVVQDNGRGIPADAQQHIFDPFFTTKGSAGGTGLGLPLARQIVLRHAGSIDVDSTPTGTLVRVCLPLS